MTDQPKEWRDEQNQRGWAPVRCSVCEAPLVAIAKASQDLEKDPVVRHYAPCDCHGMPPGELDAAVVETLRRADELDRMASLDAKIVEAAERWHQDVTDIVENGGQWRSWEAELRKAVEAKRSALKPTGG